DDFAQLSMRKRKQVLLVFFATLLPSLVFAATFTRPLSVGSTGSDVFSLQQLLHQQGYLSVSPTGYFGSLTQAAVEQYQTAHGLEAVGNVGPLTRASLNGGSSNGSTAPAQTSTSKLTQAQIQSILNLLASFGADQATLARVAAILGYQATTTAQEGGGGSPQAGTPTTIQNFAPSGGGGGSS